MNRVDHPWSLPATEVMGALGTSSVGLMSDEAKRRRERFGPNLLVTRKPDPWYALLLRQLAHPLVFVLIAAAVLKAVFKGMVDAAVIGAVLVFMAMIGFVQEMKARKAMAALVRLRAPRAKVRRDGTTPLLDAADLVPGDVVVLEAGDRVPADARVVEAAALRVNESTLTGQSMPVEKVAHPLPAESGLHARRNMVYSGARRSHRGSPADRRGEGGPRQARGGRDGPPTR